MTGAAVDLGGNLRVRGKAPDLGCFELVRRGSVMFVR